MRRPSDRWEATAAALLLVIFLAGAPLAAFFAGRAMYADDIRQQAANRSHHLHVEAVLLDDAASPYTSDDAGPTVTVKVARAQWTAPDGTSRGGVVEVAPGDRAGAKVTVWVDNHGSPSTPPATVHPAFEAATAATAAALGVAVLLIVVRLILRFVLHRRRMRSWQQEWLEVEPRWTRHR
jgi:hypothetical protein